MWNSHIIHSELFHLMKTKAFILFDKNPKQEKNWMRTFSSQSNLIDTLAWLMVHFDLWIFYKYLFQIDNSLSFSSCLMNKSNWKNFSNWNIFASVCCLTVLLKCWNENDREPERQFSFESSHHFYREMFDDEISIPSVFELIFIAFLTFFYPAIHTETVSFPIRSFRKNMIGKHSSRWIQNLSIYSIHIAQHDTFCTFQICNYLIEYLFTDSKASSNFHHFRWNFFEGFAFISIKIKPFWTKAIEQNRLNKRCFYWDPLHTEVFVYKFELNRVYRPSSQVQLNTVFRLDELQNGLFAQLISSNICRLHSMS